MSRSRAAAHDVRIRELAAAGMSSENIAKEIGHGLTKGMVVGYRDRQRIETVRPRKDSPVPVIAAAKPKGTAFNPQPWHQQMSSWAPPGPRPRTCRYIHGDPLIRGWRYCGAAAAHGAYCWDHAGMCYIGLKRPA